MAPYQRRRYYNRRPYRKRWRRFPFRRRRPRTTFHRRKRRFRVRNFYKFKKFKRKLKRLRLQQWQPNTIKKCHIKGYLPLFQCGDGRQENNYTLYKDSFTPEHEPGGGGWSIQQLSLGILYELNNDIQNIWTKSNYRLNMCRYIGCKIRCYRQPFVDYVVHYFHDAPKNVTKYYYASFHPVKMLQLQHKVIVPSFNTEPLKRKPYKTIYIAPPKLMKNQWFFQQHLASFPLIHLAASCISLTNMFGSDRAQNSNTSFFSINTTFFQNPNFQINQHQFQSYGYHINSTNYFWAIHKPRDIFTQNTRGDCILLANTLLNEPGTPAGTNTKSQPGSWGNPFYWEYLHQPEYTLITSRTQDPAEFLKTTDDLSKTLEASMQRTTQNVIKVRYNPFKDKGKGNRIYFIPNNDPTHNSWEPTRDTDILFENFPLWIMLWGIEGILKKMGKCPNLYENWMCVIQCNYLSEKEPYFVPLSDNFVNGQGAYDIQREEIPPSQYRAWFPKYKFQKEAIHNIISTAPAVCRPDHVKNFQALIHYNFFFKWGGNPSPLENVYDPNSQPITPTPNNFNLTNEIINPATDIESFLYPWDIRRDILTQRATERITQSSIYDFNLFTDTTKTTTDVPLFQETTQEKTTPKEKEKTILFYIKQLQQYNKQLQQRFNQLNISLMDL
nr:MAG: ORF1 [TTV-like mini virus]